MQEMNKQTKVFAVFKSLSVFFIHMSLSRNQQETNMTYMIRNRNISLRLSKVCSSP